jgi:hypothetical protein
LNSLIMNPAGCLHAQAANLRTTSAQR